MTRTKRCRSTACALRARRTVSAGFPAGTRRPRAATLWCCATAIARRFHQHRIFASGKGGGLYLIDPDGFVADSVEYGFPLPIERSARARQMAVAQRADSRCGKRDHCVWRPLGLVINEWMANPASGAIGLNCSTHPNPP